MKVLVSCQLRGGQWLLIEIFPNESPDYAQAQRSKSDIGAPENWPYYLVYIEPDPGQAQLSRYIIRSGAYLSFFTLTVIIHLNCHYSPYLSLFTVEIGAKLSVSTDFVFDRYNSRYAVRIG